MAIFTNNWAQLKNKAATTPWYGAILTDIQKRVDASIARGLKVPNEPGGWLHKYICQETWMPLGYNSSDPVNHTSLLGRVYKGEPFDGGWRVWRHRELANTARDAGLFYQITREERYRETAKTIVLTYVERYENFAGDEDAETWMTKGRAFNQALSEAIWAVPLIQAFDLIQSELETNERQTIIARLLRPIAATLTTAHDSLIAQKKVKSNYVAWLIAALGLVGFAINDNDLIYRSIEGEGGFKAHFDASTLADGLQYEVTPYYHNFVALAFINLAEAALANGINLYAYKSSQEQGISSLWEAFANLAYPDGTVPELNDGSYWQESIYDSEICDVFEVALARAPKETYAWLLQHAYKRRGAKRDSWTALLFAKQDLDESQQVSQESACLKTGGVVVLKNKQVDLAACIPYGEYAGSHSHYDRLGVSIWPFSQDAGTPLYGVEARVTWYQQTLAHNTVVVDGKSQAKAGGCLQQFSGDSVHLHANNLYEGVGMTRTLTLQENELSDHFTLSSDDEHRYDWLCYTDGEWKIEGLEFEMLDEPYDDSGAGAFVTLTAKADVNKRLAALTMYQRKRYGLELSADQPFELFLATCPGRSQHPHQKRHLIIARTVANKVDYQAIYRVLP